MAIRLLVALPTIGIEPANNPVQFLRPNEADWVSNAITRCPAELIALPDATLYRVHRFAGFISLPDPSLRWVHRLAGFIAWLGSSLCWFIALLVSTLHQVHRFAGFIASLGGR